MYTSLVAPFTLLEKKGRWSETRARKRKKKRRDDILFLKNASQPIGDKFGNRPLRAAFNFPRSFHKYFTARAIAAVPRVTSRINTAGKRNLKIIVKLKM